MRIEAFEARQKVIDDQTADGMKNELVYLVRLCCKSYSIDHFSNQVFLHDSTEIKYELTSIKKIEDFIEVVGRYWDYFRQLATNLSYEDESSYVESRDKAIGTLNIERTYKLRAAQGNKRVAVYSVISKNMFIPENLLFSSVLLGINIIATRYYSEAVDGIDHYSAEKHGLQLRQIIDYSSFLLKDRFVAKLLNHYLANYDGIERILIDVIRRLNAGKVRGKYYDLLQFIRESKATTWKFDRPPNSLRDALAPYFRSISEDKLYEMWVFFKILELFSPITQVNNRLFRNEETGISIEYQRSTNIDWTVNKHDNTGNLISLSEVRRVPDIVISKGGRDIAVIDAKCMKYNDVEDSKQEPGPDRSITNQMILYLDYVAANCKLGIVLFADLATRGDIDIRDKQRKILFLNCFPFSNPSAVSFSKIKRALSILC